VLRPALVAAVVVGAYAALPYGSVARDVVFAIAAVGLAAFTWTGITRLPPASRGTWRWVAAGVTVGVLADLGTDVLDQAMTDPPFPSVVHLLYPVSYLLLAIALLTIVRRGRRRDQAALLDALIVATSFGTLVWVGVIGPAEQALGTSLVGRLHVFAYSLTNVVLFVAAVRLILTVRRRSPAITLLLGFASLHLTLVIVTGILVILERYASGTVLTAVWLGTYLLLGLAVRQPSADRLPLRETEQRRHVTPWRAALLIPTTLVVPAIMVWLPERSAPASLAAATALLLLLIGARVWLLLTEVQEARDRDIEAQAQRHHRRFEAIVRHAADVLILVDGDGQVTYASPSALALFDADPTGWGVDELAAVIHPQDRDVAVQAIPGGLGADQPVRLDIRLRDRDAQEQHVELVAVDLRQDPAVQGVVITLHEASERTALAKQLRHLAFHDPLTGLGNREMFREQLAGALARLRHTEGRLALLMCDLDDFKDVNDTLGHDVGDKLLIEVGRRLSEGTRSNDQVIRLGGDEFAILCQDVESTRAAVATARRLLEAARRPMTIDGHDLRVGVSIGVVVDTGERTGDELLRDADVALYAAKGEGKDRISLHRTTMTVQAHERLRLAEDLTRAIDDHDIDVAFQPIIDLTDDRLVGVEALARWTHPTRGMVSPGEFIPVAEQSGQIPRIGSLVLDRTLGALRTWQDARPGLKLYGAVNLSARELREPNLASRIAGRIHHHRLEPSQLLLELTETGMLEDERLALNVMHELRDHGVRFAVDDFGTGYSSLSYLRRLPVDIVKIDRSFIDELGVVTAADDLVRAIIDLSRTLHLTVVAEGIETPEQRRILQAMRCPMAQGFLLGRPVDESAILRMLTRPDARVTLASDTHRTDGSSGRGATNEARTVANS
jgi:diguanylate cyclase (GGDEF)-like protein/PAS domain S-box-containing protein